MLIKVCVLIYLAGVQTNGPKVRELYVEEPLSISLQPKPQKAKPKGETSHGPF